MTESPADILVRLRRRGIRLWAEKGALHYQASEGMLTPEELAELRAAKPALLGYLESQTCCPLPEPRIPRRAPSDVVPLSFSQQWHWHRWQSWRGSFRMPCAFTHITGDLDARALQESLRELCRRHEVLTARVVTRGGKLVQEFSDPDTCPFGIIDLTGLPIREQDTAIRHHVGRLFCRPVDPSKGPAFEARLIRLQPTEHVWLSVVDHLVCDAVSRALLLSDLWRLYAEFRSGMRSSPADTPVRFSDYAVWQHAAHGSWVCTHARYWTERLAGARRVEVFPDRRVSGLKHFQLGMSQLSIGGRHSARLSWLSRQERTTLPMACLTAYAALLCRWCGTADLVIPFVTMGRFLAEVQRTVGNFAFPLFLRLELSEHDDFVDVLRRVTREYARAQEHCDLGSIAGQSDGPEFLRNPEVNCVPAEFRLSSKNDLDHSSVDGLGGLRLRPLAIEPSADEAGLNGEWDLLDWDCEPAVRFAEGDGTLHVSLLYAGDRAAGEAVERFLRNVRVFVETMAECPHAFIRAVELV